MAHTQAGRAGVQIRSILTPPNPKVPGFGNLCAGFRQAAVCNCTGFYQNRRDNFFPA